MVLVRFCIPDGSVVTAIQLDTSSCTSTASPPELLPPPPHATRRVNGASVNSYLRCIDLENQLKLIKPDLVIFSIGINDAYEEDSSQDLFYKNYDALINKFNEEKDWDKKGEQYQYLIF